jgi:hypothetical protein
MKEQDQTHKDHVHTYRKHCSLTIYGDKTPS